MSPGELVREALRAELPAAVKLRRQLHAQPSLSGKEGPTLERVLDALPGGLVEYVAGTGAVIRIGGPGPAVGVRGELDALPIAERTNVRWAATNGAMHACGHDVHLAAVIALARAVSKVRAAVDEGVDSPERTDSWSWDAVAPLVVVLQPREETYPSGAFDVVESGVLDRHQVRAMIGAHVQPVLASGVVSCTPGAVNASADEFELIVRGAEGHAAYPHLARDPVVAMSQIIVAAQQLVSRSADPMVPTVVTFGMVNAGTAPNAIPREAVARGTLRTMSEPWRRGLHDRFTQVAEDVARAHGCHGEVRVLLGEPVLANDEALAIQSGDLLRHRGWTVTEELRSCGADDFAAYASVMPALMMFVGVDTGAGLHSADFLPREDAVAATAEALLAGYLTAGSRPALAE
ncbi:M20 metallopeptidase family protein [Nonomuraea guangzhouensis]|uniref:M20 family metallopeptidase n=1 Tax=Nonomuraea guangzhouensis TaxID=1291555 RepID=A0ABW4FYD8_9ACTN|nr:M20 family metallopeptidase [Nonomuraea guangzhouensis]